MKIINRVILMFLFVQHPLMGSSQTIPLSPDSTKTTAADSEKDSLGQAADTIRLVRGVPGMVYAVFSKDSIIDFGVLGYRIFKSKDPIEKNDRFNIGTNTVAFTAYIAAKLVEAGKIKWSTQLLSIFPEFGKKTRPVYKSIRFQDLLSSRTRIPPFMDMSDWFKIPNTKGEIIANDEHLPTGYCSKNRIWKISISR